MLKGLIKHRMYPTPALRKAVRSARKALFPGSFPLLQTQMKLKYIL